MNAELILDEWLSRYLGKPVYYISGNLMDFTVEQLPKNPSLVWVKVPVEQAEELKHLQKAGFSVIDTNVQLFRPNIRANCTAAELDNKNKLDSGDAKGESNQESGIVIRFAAPEDEMDVRDIAYRSFTLNRFQFDPEITDDIASEIKAEWAGNFFRGERGEWMIIAEVNGVIAGFLQLLSSVDGLIVIDLIAVDDEFRGRKLSRKMIQFADRECAGHSVDLKVGTQIANIVSLAAYCNMGFRICSSDYVLHWHWKG